MTQTIMVTGSTGFIGRQLVPHLQNLGHQVITPTRSDIGDVSLSTDWGPYLDGVDTIIHLAGRAHVMQEDAVNPIDLYRHVNTTGTEKLANDAIKAGVKRFIFASSIKVMGESSEHALSKNDIPEPIDPYGISKLEAETILQDLANEMDIVTLRLPLVYGPGVKGNFINLLKLLNRGMPLPLGLIKNQRSMIYSQNLISAIEYCLTGRSGVYLPSDQQDLSTPQLIKSLAQGLNKSVPLIPMPVFLLKFLGLVLGKDALVQRLTGSLFVDGLVDRWRPPFTAEEGLKATAKSYKNHGAVE